MNCNNICKTYKSTGPASSGRYKNGQKRCTNCEVFIKFEGTNCPCCGVQLRVKPKNKKYKEKLREEIHT